MRSPWVRRSLLGALVAALLVAGGALWRRANAPESTTSTTRAPAPPSEAPATPSTPAPPPSPAPSKLVESTPPAPPAPPAPAEPTTPLALPPASASVATQCPRNVASIGTPIASELVAPRRARYPDARSQFAIDATGCAIAVVLAKALYVTWDGGRSFARYPAEGEITYLTIIGNRAAMLRDNALGIVHAGDAEIAWRDLGPLAVQRVDASGKRRVGAHVRLVAAGAWLAVLRHGPGPDEHAQLAGISEDDGATWHYLVPPVADTFDLTDDGQLRISGWEPVDDAPSAKRVQNFYASDAEHASWISSTKFRAPHGAYRYDLERATSWSCCDLFRLVAFRDERAAKTLAEGIDPSASQVAVVQNAVAAYALWDKQTHKLSGTRETALGAMDLDDLIGVDRYGALLAHSGPLLLRWTESGEWRLLWPPAPAATPPAP